MTDAKNIIKAKLAEYLQFGRAGQDFPEFILDQAAENLLGKISTAQDAAEARAVEQSDGSVLTGVWPDFIAPSKYENPDPRWIDPGLPDFRLIWKIAREAGYSIGLHGSMKRDCDMIAAPWTEEAISAQELIDRLCGGLNADALPIANPKKAAVLKPHGRVAWALQIKDAYKKVLDVSVMPRTTRILSDVEAVDVEAAVHAEREACATLCDRIQRRELGAAFWNAGDCAAAIRARRG